MFYLEKKLEIAAAHNLKLNYESKCSNVHGHNWSLIVFCKSETLDENGMIVDFTKIKEIVMSLDHKYLNDILSVNPTAEYIAKYLCDSIPFCYKVEVEESTNNKVTYVSDK
jgi:6-pyruvoyltetrahydropterin/6-carboxytetrahydropterin synthase